MKIAFTDREHRAHCYKAKCKHPIIYKLGEGQTSQGWCARCRCVAFGGVYEGLAFVDGQIVEVGRNPKVETSRPLN